MNTLAVRLFLLVEQRVFILWQHLLLARHFPVPPIDGSRLQAVTCKGGADGVYHIINGAKALPLASLLGLRDSPWDLPVLGQEGMVSIQARPLDEDVRGGAIAKDSKSRRQLIRIHTKEDPKREETSL